MALNLNEKRLLKDVININKHPLNDQGIYYLHDSDNIKKGYALIIGPQDTIYSHGMYFFEFNYPDDYPFSPPKLTYLTNGDGVRFNPNLYRNGKVCVSILNTWSGPQWSSCQTISSILLTLTTLFHNKPLLNEPGLTESCTSFKPYNKAIRYSSIKVALFDVLNKKICKNMFNKFKNHIIDYVKKNENDIIKDIDTIDEFLTYDVKVIKCSVYSIKLNCVPKGTFKKDFQKIITSLN
jgi:ubiquitin-protein ligase